jgi:thiamine-monophosphate kinase
MNISLSIFDTVGTFKTNPYSFITRKVFNLTTSKTFGERTVIQWIIEKLERMPEMPICFGDDVSGCSIGNGEIGILKTDMFVDRTDAPSGMSFWQMARKTVVMNVSDFAAKGVQPKVMLVSLGMPRELGKDEIDEIGRGLNAGAREYDSYIIGGDTNETSDLVISLSVFGIAKRRDLMLRSRARPGDLLAVTGPFGITSAGLRILLNNSCAPPEIHEALVESVFMPHARLKEGLALCKTRAVSASIDSSDGLAWSLHEIAESSNVGILVDRLPIDKEVETFAEVNKLDPLELALYGGEEYELVLGIKPEFWNQAEAAVEKVGGRILRIGRTTAEKRLTLEFGGERRVIEPRGYEHFKT